MLPNVLMLLGFAASGVAPIPPEPSVFFVAGYERPIFIAADRPPSFEAWRGKADFKTGDR